MKRLDLLIELLQAIYTILQNYTQTHPRVIAPHGGLEEWPNNSKRLLSKQEAMDYLGITESTYYRWINDNKLRPRGAPGRDHYYENDLLALKDRRRHRERG